MSYSVQHNRYGVTPKVTVRCAIGATQIIGSYFFEDNGQTTTVNSKRYIEMLTQFFFLSFDDDVQCQKSVVSTRRGNITHSSCLNGDSLPKISRSLILRFGGISKPPCSLDLSICDFFLWSYLKSKVYQ